MGFVIPIEVVRHIMSPLHYKHHLHQKLKPSQCFYQILSNLMKMLIIKRKTQSQVKARGKVFHIFEQLKYGFPLHYCVNDYIFPNQKMDRYTYRRWVKREETKSRRIL